MTAIRKIKGLTCYSVHVHEGKVRTALYRPIRGPWTPALRKLVPSASQGIAEDDGPVEKPASEPRPKGKGRSIIREELRARQGSLEV